MLPLSCLKVFHLAGQVFVIDQELAQLHEGADNQDFIRTARSLPSTGESMATPCSVNAYGG